MMRYVGLLWLTCDVTVIPVEPLFSIERCTFEHPGLEGYKEIMWLHCNFHFHPLSSIEYTRKFLMVQV